MKLVDITACYKLHLLVLYKELKYSKFMKKSKWTND